MNDDTCMRQNLYETIIQLNNLGLNHGATGNCSIRKENSFLISPSGIGNNLLKPDHMVEMNMDGTIKKINKYEPSSEWKFHKDIFEKRNDVNAIVHTHSLYASALSVFGKPIPQFHYMIAVSGGKVIPCAKYAIFGSQQLSNNIIKSLGKQKACLISNHGLVSVGSNLAESANIAEEVEHLSQMYMEVKLHGEPNLLSDDEMNEVLVRFQSYGDWKKE